MWRAWREVVAEHKAFGVTVLRRDPNSSEEKLGFPFEVCRNNAPHEDDATS